MCKSLVTIGGPIAFAAFFMPWFSACGEDISGAQLASHPEQHTATPQDASSWVLLWLVLAAALLVAVLGLMLQRSTAPAVIGASATGLLIVGLAYLSIEDKSMVDIKYGYWLELTGFGGGLVGAVLSLSEEIEWPPG